MLMKLIRRMYPAVVRNNLLDKEKKNLKKQLQVAMLKYVARIFVEPKLMWTTADSLKKR